MGHLVLAAALVGYLTVVTPWLGRHTYERLVRDRDRDPGALVRMFRLWIGDTWAITAVALAVVWLTPELDAARIGITLGTNASLVVAMLGGMALTVALVALAARLGRPLPTPSPGAFTALLPRTAAERRYALGLAVTAGVGEEIVYRGVLIGLGTHVLGLPVPVAAGLALAVFVLGHLYQGRTGMLVVTLGGLVFTFAYLYTGSLLLPIALHVLIDIRSLLFTRHDSSSSAPAPVRG